MRHTYTTYLSLYLGTEEELPCKVVGTYYPPVRAFTPRGEFAPIDPPGPAAFEIDEIFVEVRSDPGKEPVWIALDTKLLSIGQLSALADEACEDAAESRQPDPDYLMELRRER